MLNKKLKSYTLIPCTLILSTSLAIADNSDELVMVTNSNELEEVIVTAGYADVERVSSTKSVIVIEREDIQDNGYENIDQILDEVPSINVGKADWGQIDIRGQGQGSSAKNLQVMVDGAPITTLVNHPMQTNYNVIPVDQIEKIEIIPGGGSILYGSGSAGGVINITTNLKNIHKTKKSIKIGAGTNHKDITVHLGHNFNDQFSGQLSYSKLNKDLYFKNTYRDSDYIAVGLNYKLKENQNISLRYSGLFEDGRFVKSIQNKNLEKLGRDYIPRDQTITVGLDANNHKIKKIIPGYTDANRTIHSLNATYTGSFDNIKFNTDLFYNKGNFGNTNLNLVMDTNTIGVKNKLDIEYGQNSAFEGSSILIGLDAFKQNANLAYDDYNLVSWANKTYKINPLSFEYDKATIALYALNDLRYKDFNFTQGVRFDRTRWGFDKVASRNSGKDTSKRNNVNLALGVGYDYSESGQVYARYEHTFTAPDGLEITDDFSSQDIHITKAEDTIYDMYEIGLRDEFDFLTVDLTAFYSKTDNEMTRNYVMDPVLGFGRKSINVLKTDRKGIELALTQKFGKLTLSQSYAYLKGHREYNGQAEKFGVDVGKIDWTNAGLKKVPKNKFIFKIKYDINDKWSVSGKYKYSGGYSNFINEKDFKEECFHNYWGNLVCTSPKFEKREDALIKSHSVVDVNVSYKNRKGLSVSAGVNNLLDERYFEYSGGGKTTDSVRPSDERSYYINTKYSF